MNAAEKKAHARKCKEWYEATIQRIKEREAEVKAEAAKKPLTLEEADAMNRRGEKVDFDKYHLESFEENFVRNIWENTTNKPDDVKLVTCRWCGSDVKKLYGSKCAKCLIRGV